jgi:hypothetical protein
MALDFSLQAPHPMLLALRLDPSRLRQWHRHVAERLAQRPDTTVVVEWGTAAPRPARAVELLLALERRIHGGRTAATAPATAADFAAWTDSPLKTGVNTLDVVVDLCGDGAAAPADARLLRLTFDGGGGEEAALAALIGGRTPVVAVIEAATGAEVVSGHAGSETHRVLGAAFADIAARAATLLVAALDGAAARYAGVRPPPADPGAGAAAGFCTRSLAMGAAAKLYQMTHHSPHWRLGWRFVDGHDVIDLGGHPAGGWHELTDPGSRFFADPFPVEKDGRIYLFLEDFDHRLGRGHISVMAFGDEGPLGTPQPVLRLPTHLSYPFVFEHKGEMWMIPESCATASIDLYRATDFPGGWTKEATLVSGPVASDATVFEHDGRWWMLATVKDGGSFSDALFAWWADDLAGPWYAHRRNPLMVDIATARPAGRVVRRGGRLIRPFQDCRDGYGRALGLAEILRLDDENFAQRVLTVVRPGPLWRGRHLHTLNRAGRLECIDGTGWSRRF